MAATGASTFSTGSLFAASGFRFAGAGFAAARFEPAPIDSISICVNEARKPVWRL